MIVAIPLTLLAGLSVMNILAAGHYFLTLLAAPFVWLPPAISRYSLPSSMLKKEWPPLFDGPLEAISVRDFWSHRWHALFRRTFLINGGVPGLAVGGYLGGLINSIFPLARENASMRRTGMRFGGVIGVFFVSGVMHDLGAWGVGKGTEFRSITGYFLLQGVAVVLEEALGLTGVGKPKAKADKASNSEPTANGNGVVIHEMENYRSPSGLYHYFMGLWSFVWVVLPATFMLDAWLRRGVTCVIIVPHSLSPARALIRVWNDFAYTS
ncbi:membrane bound O-acyl transferase family protein [Ceratobasidium sp. AG-Ba]|nr:membrane bound O-acyl transferase family protein [Ceratobasidium sp. AG-Ba]